MISRRYNWHTRLRISPYLARTVYLSLLYCITNSVYGLSADEAQTYNFTNSALNAPVTPVNFQVKESRNAENTKFESSLSRSDPNLDKRALIQLNNGFVNLTDDTRVWITPSGAALNVKY